jgi:geranylgeranyl reductase family protein
MFEVIVVGAGPAGSIAAYELAVKGINVLILEKAAFPRYKVCGGGLTHKIVNALPFDVNEVVEATIHSIRFSSNLGDSFTRTSATPLMYCTMRDRLDDLLLRKAIEAGARVEFLQQVTSVKELTGHVEVTTKTAVFQSRLVIGADGPSSIVARSVGLRSHIEQGLAWEAEVYTDASILERFSHTVFLDWGTFPGGYGWVFPKKDHFSMGVGGPAGLSRHMMPYYQKFLAYLDFGLGRSPGENGQVGSWSEFPFVKSLKSWPIPVRVKKGEFQKGMVLVAGDAGGLADSLTGEGIYYAVASGKMAAEAASHYLQGESDALTSYSVRINDTLMTELLEGEKIKHIFNAVPGRIHRFVRDSDRAWNAFGKILRGEKNYTDVKNGFGKWKMFWDVAVSTSRWVEKRKESKFKIE